MTKLIEELASRQRFGMKPGLETITEIARRLGNPEKSFKTIHVAGTNGKGAVCAILSSVLGCGRYTSPHLVKLNERFFVDGGIIDDATLERAGERVSRVIAEMKGYDVTFFEALTAVAFLIYAENGAERVIFETGLGGRLDATNICNTELSVITRIGLEHCDWLGDTIEKIAFEKAGIIKEGVPVVLGDNSKIVRDIIEARAKELNAPFFYAPCLACESEIPSDFALKGSFNRENAVTALAALRVIDSTGRRSMDFGCVAPDLNPLSSIHYPLHWPGRFQEVGSFIIDGAHNPPAARALVGALGTEKVDLICGFCADKDIAATLRILSPNIVKGIAVKTNNPRSVSAKELAALMNDVGIEAVSMENLSSALQCARASSRRTLVCGSLFLAGEAVVALDAYPWVASRFDPSEKL